MVGDNLRCQRCEHLFTVHHGPCCHRKVGSWDEKIQAFTREVLCECEAYIGVHPKDLHECPHETVSTDPTRCVHCLKIIPVHKK
jgi:hypothetical protein